MKTNLFCVYKILFGILFLMGPYLPAYSQSTTCAGATTLTSNTTCTNPVLGDFKSSVVSTLPALCGTVANTNDIWFKYTATDAFPTITVSGEGTELQSNLLKIQLFNNNCSALSTNLLACSPTHASNTSQDILDVTTQYSTGLTIGSTYLIRLTTDVKFTPSTNGNKNGFTICITPPAPPPTPTYTIDYSKAYVNITDGTGGGTINQGDVLEIRATFVIGGDNTVPIKNIQFFDTLRANKGLSFKDSIATRTNEGKVVKAFTAAMDGDPGFYNTAGLGSDTTIQINVGPLATQTTGGTLYANSRPSFYKGTCIIMATYRVTVTGGYGTKINFGGGALRYTVGTSNFTINFPQDSLIVFQTLDACSDAVSPANLIGTANNGTFGTATGTNQQNGGPASINTSYTYSLVGGSSPQDYYYGVLNNTSPSKSINTTLPKGSGPDRVFGIWDITGDHTGAANTAKGNPPCDVNQPVSTSNPCGYLLAVNSAYRTDKVFEYTASGICTDTYYEVSAWFKNLCYRCGCDSVGNGSGTAPVNGVPIYIPTAPGDSSGVRPNVTMQIDGINYYSTGELVYQGLGGTQTGSDSLNKWVRRSFVFKTSPTQTSFTITFKNNAPGGGGNDWAVDDIGLRTCYPDMIYAPPNPIVLMGQSLDLQDTVRSYFDNYGFYKWQKAAAATPTIFIDIAGTQGYLTPVLNPKYNQYEYVAKYTILGTATLAANSGDRYRVIVASNVPNLGASCGYSPSTTFGLYPADAACKFTATNSALAPPLPVLNWNKLNWDQGHIPSCCESAYITFTGSKAVYDTVTVNITNDICIINLTLINNSTNPNQIFKTVLHPGYNMRMNGDVRMGASSSSTLDSCIFISKGGGTITIYGNTIIGRSGDQSPSIFGSAPGTTNYANYILKGDSLAFFDKALTSPKFTNIILDPTSGTTKLVNNTNFYTNAVTFDKLSIGNGSPKNAILLGTNQSNYVNNNGGYVDVTAGSSLTMGANYSLNELTPSANSSFYLRPGSFLNLGGISGGVSGSNFPANFPSYTLDPTSTVIYNGANQTLAGTGDDVSLYGNITLTGSGIKKGSPTNVNLAGNFYRQNGGHTFDGNGGRVTFTSSTIAQKYYADATATPMNFYDLTNNNTTSTGLFIDSTIGVVNELELKTSTTTTLRTGDIVMRSSSARTSHVKDLGTTIPPIIYNGTNRFIIERYLYGQKSWRFLATPLQLVASDAGTPTVAQAWRENKGPLSANGYGTSITGPTGPYGATGEFDYYTQRGSLKYYNDISNVFTEVTNNTTTTSLPNLTGYMVFVRGDRGAANDPSGAGTATTLRMKGKIRTANQTFSVLGNKYQSIGNPYASQINFVGTVKTSIANGFIVWNPTLSGLYGVGGYENYIFNTSDYWLNGVVGGTKRNTIESGEAFFVQNNIATAGSLTIQEANKGIASQTSSRGNINEEAYPTVDVTLQEKGNNGDYVTQDGVSTSFDKSFSKALDNDDVTKFTNSYDNLFIQSNNNVLVVERRPALNETDTIHLGITGTRSADYRLHIAPYLFTNSSLDGYVNDKFLGIQTPFKLTDSANVDFKITSDAASRAADRFMIVFKPIPLPVFTKISAIRINRNNARVNWEVEKERNVENYIIERSTDSINFSAAGKQNATLNDGSKIDYFGDDTKAVKAKTWYRVKIITKAGALVYSPLAMINEFLDPKIFVSPNPVVDGKVNLFFNNQLPGTYSITISNQAGQIVRMKTIFINSYTEKQVIDLGNVAAGVYQVQVNRNGTETTTSSVIVK